MNAQRPRGPTPSRRALARVVVEIERRAAARGWDAPVGVFALVRTAAALAQDPDLAGLLDTAAIEEVRADPCALTAIEQEGLPPAADLGDLLGRLTWPPAVDGAAVSVERIMVGPASEAGAAAIEDPGERIAFIRTRPDRQDVRLVAGVLRSGEAWCAVRARSHDSDAAVIQGEAVVPGLVEALAATLA